MRPHARQQLLELERLGDVVDGADLESADLVDRLRQRRHEDDRDVADGGILLEPFACREAVQVGHQHVEQDQIRMRVGGALDRALAILRDQHVESGLPEQVEEHAEIRRRIVDDQDDGLAVRLVLHRDGPPSSRNWQSLFT